MSSIVGESLVFTRQDQNIEVFLDEDLSLQRARMLDELIVKWNFCVNKSILIYGGLARL